MTTRRRPQSSRRGGPRSRCRGCGTEIFWLTYVKADGTRGKLAPIDRAPAFNGNVEIDLGAETYRVVPLADAHAHQQACDAGGLPKLRLNHHASCTNLTYRRGHGRPRVPSADETEAQEAWERDAAPCPLVDVDVPAPRDEIALPAPGEYLIDPEEADGEPDE